MTLNMGQNWVGQINWQKIFSWKHSFLEGGVARARVNAAITKCPRLGIKNERGNRFSFTVIWTTVPLELKACVLTMSYAQLNWHIKFGQINDDVKFKI